MSSCLSMCSKVGSLCCRDLGGVNGNAVNNDRNPGKRARINTAIGTMVRCGRGCSSRGVVCGEVGGFSSSNFWGVLDGQGCHVGKSGSVVSGPSVHHSDSGQAEERNLKMNNPDTVYFNQPSDWL